MPTSFPRASTTLAAPGRPSVRVITAAVSRSEASQRTVGLREPVRITSGRGAAAGPARLLDGARRTARERSRGVLDRHRQGITHRQQGHGGRGRSQPRGQASGTGPISSTASARSASEFRGPEVIATMGAPSRRMAGSSRTISSVSPLFDRARTGRRGPGGPGRRAAPPPGAGTVTASRWKRRWRRSSAR